MIINEFQDANGTPFGVGLPIIKVEMMWVLEDGMYMGLPDFMAPIMGGSSEPVLISVPEGMDKEGIYILKGTNDPEDYDGVIPKIPFFTQIELVDGSIFKSMLGTEGAPTFPEGSVVEDAFIVGVGGGIAVETVISSGLLRFPLGILLKVSGEWYFMTMMD